MESAVHQLASFRADPEIFGVRGTAKGVVVKHDDFWAAYDNHTLVYDAVWLPETQTIKLFFPKLISFEAALAKAEWAVDGQRVIPRKRRRFRVYDTLELPAQDFAGDLSLHIDGHDVALAFNHAAQDRFTGRRVLYTQVKNDNLSWIKDWVSAHVRNHGVDAVVIANNESTMYTSEELRAVLAEIAGLAVADVIDLPLPYGPHPRLATLSGLTAFQQVTMLNIVRDRWFGKAAGVLQCDVDELVVSENGSSIFDATQKSFFKFLRFNGTWRYVGTGVHSATHVDHVYRPTPEEKCPSKYCIVPDSWLGRKSWAVHSLESVNRRLFPAAKHFHFYHCKSINTLWKTNRKAGSDTQFVIDSKTQNFLAQTFRR